MFFSLRDETRFHRWSFLVIAAYATFAPRAASAALVNYEVLNGFQQAWTGTFDVPSLTAPIGTGSNSSPSVTTITAVAASINWSFAPSGYDLGPTSGEGPFVKWTGTTGTASSLFLIDSSDLYSYASSGGTWGGLIGQTFSAVANVYYIDAENIGQLFTDGGSITFPVPEPSTYAMALAGAACGGFSMWRRRRA